MLANLAIENMVLRVLSTMDNALPISWIILP